MQKINRIVESEQLKCKGFISTLSRSIRSFHKQVKAGRTCLGKSCFLLVVAGLLLTNCSQFALLTTGGGLVLTNNAYVKTFNTIDLVTIVSTKSDIKTHAYNYIVKPTNEHIIVPTILTVHNAKTLVLPDRQYTDLRLMNFIYPKSKPIFTPKGRK